MMEHSQRNEPVPKVTRVAGKERAAGWRGWQAERGRLGGRQREGSWVAGRERAVGWAGRERVLGGAGGQA